MLITTGCNNPYLSDIDSSVGTPNIQENKEEDIKSKAENATGHIKLGLCNLDTLNPLKTENKTLIKYLMLVFESLIEFDQECKVKGLLANDFYTNDNGLSWTFVLKENVYFHDGSLFTAYDVKNTIEWIKANPCVYSENVNGIAEIEIIKNNELKIILNEANSLFPALMTVPILKSEDLKAELSNYNGTGMYRHINNYNFEIFSNYHGNYPQIKSFEILSFKNDEELYNSDSDIMFFYGDNVIRYNDKVGYSNGIYDDNFVSGLLPSSKVDIKTKQYLYSFLDRTLIKKALYSTKATEKYVPIAENTYFLEKFEPKSIKLDKNLPSEIKIIVNQNDEELLRISQFINTKLPDTIKTEILICNDDEFYLNLKEENYDFALTYAELKAYPDFYDSYHTLGLNNINKFTDSSVDSLIMSIRDAFKNSEISLVKDYNDFFIYSSIQTQKLASRFEETLPFISICQRKSSIFIKETLTGMSLYNFNFWNTMDSFEDLKLLEVVEEN